MSCLQYRWCVPQHPCGRSEPEPGTGNRSTNSSNVLASWPLCESLKSLDVRSRQSLQMFWQYRRVTRRTGRLAHNGLNCRHLGNHANLRKWLHHDCFLTKVQHRNFHQRPTYHQACVLRKNSQGFQQPTGRHGPAAHRAGRTVEDCLRIRRN